MKTTKQIENNKTIYTKPRGYAPERKNRTNWHFADKRTLTCEQIYQIGMSYYKRTQESKARHRIKNVAQLVKLFYWIYITGSYPSEIFKQKLSIEIVHEPNKDYLNIKRSREGKTEILMTLPILDQAEQKMLNVITDNGMLTEANHIFKFELWKSIKQNNISNLFKKAFISTLEEPITKKQYKEQGIAPMLLRYLRFRNLLMEHKAPYLILESWFGSNLKQLREKDPELKRMLDLKEQKEILERAKLMPELKLGFDYMPTY